ncbi:MAG: PIN domain-containing protein [Planctomycetota bacterium]
MSPRAVDRKLVAIDASVLQHVPGAGGDDEKMSARVAWLFEKLKSDKVDIILPAPALTEMLAAFSNSEASERYAYDIQEAVAVVGYDVAASIVAADLFRERARGSLRALYAEDGKQKFKVDLMIIATAVTRGCVELFTCDERMALMARGAVKVSLLTTLDDAPLLEASRESGLDPLDSE